ncbi:MAG TPA: PAS domain S-box protein [Thermoplasmata archaeon]|nr:PAS domain S-box protein [Thermoplasmata archaeon]
MQKGQDGFSDVDIQQATSVITCDLQGTVTKFTNGAQRLFGYAPDEVVGKLSVATFHIPANLPMVPDLLKTAVEKGIWESDLELVKKGGHVFRARLAVRPMLRDGQLVGFMGITRALK